MAAKRDKERGKRRWTAAGAARAARDARIATTAFLRNAPVMRKWHTSKMLLSHQVLVAHMRREMPHDEAAYMSALRLLLAGLGYPASWRPSNMAEIVETVLADEARYVASSPRVGHPHLEEGCWFAAPWWPRGPLNNSSAAENWRNPSCSPGFLLDSSS